MGLHITSMVHLLCQGMMGLLCFCTPISFTSWLPSVLAWTLLELQRSLFWQGYFICILLFLGHSNILGNTVTPIFYHSISYVEHSCYTLAGWMDQAECSPPISTKSPSLSYIGLNKYYMWNVMPLFHTGSHGSWKPAYPARSAQLSVHRLQCFFSKCKVHLVTMLGRTQMDSPSSSHFYVRRISALALLMLWNYSFFLLKY